MKDEPFFDTNILYYAYDLSEHEKREKCKVLVQNVFNGESTGVISNQILVELFNALSRKLGLTTEISKIIVKSFLLSANWVIVNYTHVTIEAALDSAHAYGSPFLDTLIVETMKEHGLTKIYTENERDFKKIPGIIVRNPLG